MKELIKKLTGNRKLKYIIVLLLFVVILLVVEVYKKKSGDWLELETKDFMKGVSYYDKNIVKNTTNQNIQVRIKTIYEGEGRVFFTNMFSSYISKGDENQLKGFSYIISTNEINCIEKKGKILSSTLYDEKGNVLYTKTYENEGWKPIPPNTDLEELTKQICN